MTAPGHAVITRFCCRSTWAGPKAGVYWNKKHDPLARANVVRRFALLEAVCLPNVLAQTEQDFAWVLLVDQDLPPEDRARLADLCALRPQSYLHTYTGEDLRRVDWLRPYLPEDASPVITTLWDDDDALPDDYLQLLRRHLQESADHWSPLRSAGTRACTQWDMRMSRQHPFGTRSPWHRGNFPKSPGFSVISAPPVSVSVLGMDHTIGGIWHERQRGDGLDDVLMATSGERSNPHVEQLLDEFQTWLDADELLDRAAGSAEDLYCDLTAAVGPVLMTNHGKNAQAARLWQTKASADVVKGAESFERVVVDWSVLHRERRLFSASRLKAAARLEKLIQRLKNLGRGSRSSG